MSITKNGKKSYSFKVGSDTVTFPTFSFLTPKSISSASARAKKYSNSEDISAEAKLIKVIPGSKPERPYYDLFPDLSVEQMQTVVSFFEKHEPKKHEAMRELSMFPETKMNHFIKLLELKNICTKGVFFVTSGTSDFLMKSRETQDFKKMGKELISCLEDETVEFIVMYLNLNLPDSGFWSLFRGKVFSHRNSIIIDKKHRKLIRFEPMGALPKAQQNITISEIHMKIYEYLTTGEDTNLSKHMDDIRSFEYFDTNKFDIYSCPFISAPQLGNIFCQTYSIYGALLYIINNDVFNKTPSSLFVALGDMNKIMLMWYLAMLPIRESSARRRSSNNRAISASQYNPKK